MVVLGFEKQFWVLSFGFWVRGKRVKLSLLGSLHDWLIADRNGGFTMKDMKGLKG